LHDFSQRRELSLHAEVAAGVTTALGAKEVPCIVVGAFARDLHLHYGADVPIQRGTQDIDFAFAVRSWDEFHALRHRLLESGSFQGVEGKQHRLRHRNKLTVDLLPFGSIETDDRRITWPPRGDVVMDVFGFQESVASAERVVLPANVEIAIVSLPALALLKIVAWEDRHRRVPGKDAADLSLIMRSYLAVPVNAQRLWSEFIDWTESPEFDYEHSGARMLGCDLRRLVDEMGRVKVNEILCSQIEVGLLPQEMDRRAPDAARGLLQSLVEGLDARVAGR
jgi:predicted nucleotidyltransferase